MKALDLKGLKRLYDIIHTEIINMFNRCDEELNAALDIIADDYATKDELNSAVSGLISFDTCIVESLPATGTKGIIYLYRNENDINTNNLSYYNEYIWIESSNKFELIGTTEINVDDIVSTDQMDTAISNALVEAKSYADDKIITIQDLTDNIEYTRDEITKYNTRLCKFGNFIILYMDVIVVANNEALIQLGTIPEAARPKVNVTQNMIDNNGDFCYFYCNANGIFGFRYAAYKTGNIGIRHTMFFVSAE